MGNLSKPTRWMQRRWHFAGILLTLLLSGRAQATVIYTVGTASGSNYPTIGAALAAVPSTLTEPYELRLVDAAYSENILLNKTGTDTKTLTIKPAAGLSPVITGTLTFGVGSAFTILNGNNGTITRALTLQQPSQTVPTVIFVDDASHNTVSEVVVLGSNTTVTGGVVVVGSGINTGNDYNTITLSFIGNADPGTLPANLVYATNVGGGANDDFTLSDNQLFNAARTGVLVGTGNGNQWTISGNSFYYNASAVPTTAQTAINFHPGSSANNATVSNNFIGGRAAGATGGIWENTGNQNFNGIIINCGTSTSLTNELTNNTVSQISLTGAGSSAALTALNVDAGRVELSGNSMSNVTNTGTSGVNSLVSRGTSILSAFSVSNGQLMVVDNGLTVVLGSLVNAGILNHTGGNMLINGSFTNASTGIFAQTAGDLEIKGDMLNSGAFNCSTGKVKLTGTGPQLVSGGLYFNLEVNGSGTKTLTDDAEIFNGVQMISGILSTGSFRLKIDPLANLTETDASYVLGRVEVRRTPADGVAEAFGGVGLVMQPVAASTLPGSTLITRVTGTAPVGVGNQGILRYFDITAAVTSGLDLGLTIEYMPHELNGIAPANLRFFKSVDNGATWQKKGLTSAGTGYAFLSGVSGFSRWTLADVNAPLPVGISAFQAERQGQNAVLTWTTATEQDNRGFGIEVSADGKTFREIGFVAAEGSSNTTAGNYRFVDAAEGKTGSRYYRLRQDDLTASLAHYFGPRMLNFGAAPLTLAAYPTAFSSDLTVALTTSTATTATLRLFDVMGREVWHQEQAVVPGAAPLHIQPTCAAGSYVLTATMAGQVLRQRVVKN